MCQLVTQGKGELIFFVKKLSKSLYLYHQESYRYPSNTEIAEATETLLQEQHNRRENFLTFEMSQRTQKYEICFEIKFRMVQFSISTWVTNIRVMLASEFTVMLRQRRHHEREFAYNMVRIHSFMFEYNYVGETKALPFVSQLESEEIVTNEQCMNYQTFCYLQLRLMLENSSQSIQIDLGHTSCEKIPFVFVGNNRFVLMLRKTSGIHS